jgi:hypothetical protein
MRSGRMGRGTAFADMTKALRMVRRPEGGRSAGLVDAVVGVGSEEDDMGRRYYVRCSVFSPSVSPDRGARFSRAARG